MFADIAFFRQSCKDPANTNLQSRSIKYTSVTSGSDYFLKPDLKVKTQQCSDHPLKRMTRQTDHKIISENRSGFTSANIVLLFLRHRDSCGLLLISFSTFSENECMVDSLHSLPPFSVYIVTLLEFKLVLNIWPGAQSQSKSGQWAHSVQIPNLVSSPCPVWCSGLTGETKRLAFTEATWMEPMCPASCPRVSDGPTVSRPTTTGCTGPKPTATASRGPTSSEGRGASSWRGCPTRTP